MKAFIYEYVRNDWQTKYYYHTCASRNLWCICVVAALTVLATPTIKQAFADNGNHILRDKKWKQLPLWTVEE